ncbi:MAG: phosphoribosylformylglycinamidine synthase subunit PurQ [Thermoanaerobaculia bacterium]|jgi:phosphoribosylformylglycinamidine synthase|nr:MAG: phosphoribosylformylglycinamidine synthase subunit PurQ [Thermoanaerobaculia bacterium]MBZ0102211.1 phosphoribosylformylglycinamidine synthase subunit PurQ [Thermoanaerobaculia bacterium]
MRCGVVVFPGSNCDHDVYHVLKHLLDQDVCFLWHEDSDLRGCELIVLPGGWSYGDYLRGGAMAALSPVMGAVREHAGRGGLVLGICNGFQVLTESHLLPGALRRNRGLRFECRDVWLRVERNDLPFTRRYQAGQVIRMPIAHGEGNYENTPEGLERLEANGQVALRYVSPAGELDDGWNFNGSARGIAGLVNEQGNVLGLMPHPERCAEEVLGNRDGLALFQGLVESSVGRLAGAAR